MAEVGPTGLFNEFLKRFGTTSPQVAIVASTIVVAFGLKERIDVGVWTIVWLLTFAFSYLISDLLPRTTARALLLCAAFFACAAAAAWAVARYAPAWVDFVAADRVVLSGLAAYLVAQPTGILLYAYQQRSRSQGHPLPASLVELAEREIWGAKFFREDMRYEVEFLLSSGRVEVATKLSYKVTNRSFDRLSYPVTMKHDPVHGRVTSFRVDYKPQPTTNPGVRTQSGLDFKLPLAPGQTAVVEAELVESLAIPGWELFGTYYPTTSFALILRNKSHPILKLDVEPLAPDAVEASDSGNEYVRVLPSGVLPNQGFRVHWFV